MRHMIRGRQLSRDTEHRRAMRRNLVQSLFENGAVRTTLPKAKEVRAMAEKLITVARDGLAAGDSGPEKRLLNARRKVVSLLRDRRLTDEEQEFILNDKGNPVTVVQKLFNDVAPKFADRQGGYTRIIKLSDYRIGDGGSLVLLQLLTEESKPTGTARRSAGLRRRRNEKKRQFASKAARGTRGGEQAPQGEQGGEARQGENAGGDQNAGA